MRRSYKHESEFQSALIREIKKRLPGSIVIKGDSGHIQGIPDLIIFWGDHWGALECKLTPSAPHQPNQDYYIARMDGMSFARFVDPVNKEEVLNAMEQALRA